MIMVNYIKQKHYNLTEYDYGKLHKMKVKVKVSLSHTILRLEHFHYLNAENRIFFNLTSSSLGT